MAKDINLFDSITSKKEAAVTLAGFGIGTIFAVIGADYLTVAIGIKEAISLPAEVHATGTSIATALLGYIIGKRS